MKKICMVLVLGLVLMSSLVTAQISADKPPRGEHFNVNFVVKPMFSDVFDDEELSQWTQITGTWGIVAEGENNVCSLTGGSYVGGVVATAGSEDWTDYSLEFDVKKVTADRFNVVFRYIDENNYYLLEPSVDCVHIALFKKVEGVSGFTELTSPRPSQEIAYGTWYHYKIVVKGDSIKVYVDDTLKIDESDFDLVAGKIGIGACALSAGTVYFDNITVMKPNEILVAFNGQVPGLRYVAGDVFEILDHDAGVFDGDAAVLQMPCDDVYDVYCSMRGRPGGEIIWGCNHVRYAVPPGKPTWHQHVPNDFTLRKYGCALGPYPVTTSNEATILALRWYPQ